MKKSMKIALWISLGMVLLGLVLSGIAFGAVGFRVKELVNPLLSVTEPHTFRFAESVSSVEIRDSSCDVRVLPANDGQITVVCEDTARCPHRVAVENGILKVECAEDWEWYEYLLPDFSKDRHVTVYLPETMAEGSLSVSVSSGDVSLTGLSFLKNVSVQSSSGDITVKQCTVQEALEVRTSSGDMDVMNCSLGGFRTESSSGDGEFHSITALWMDGSASSGDLELTNVICAETLLLKTSSGDVDVKSCDGASLSLETTSGDVEATLRTGKMFHTETSSGRVRVPSDSEGGICNIVTVSGDISVKVNGQK